MGAVTEWVRRVLPGTYQALVGSSGTTFYSQSDVQALADYVKYRLFASNTHTAYVSELTEAVTYDPVLTEFLGKLTVLQFIPPAVDYWGQRLLSETTTGTSETTTWPDRRPDLWKIFEAIRDEVNAEWDQMASQYGFNLQHKANRPKISYGDNGRGILLSPDVYEIMRPAFPHHVRPWTRDLIHWDNGDVSS